MEEILCPVCPNHCRLKLEQAGGALLVTGQLCHRGAQFAQAEWDGDRKVVSYRVATIFPDLPTVAVQTTAAVPKELVFKLIRHMKKLSITQPPISGMIVETNPLGLPCNLIIAEEK